ncbi:hypothetical protein GQ44DRAFT_623364 [Phaeosphaeriaceae sp. PMI808]|nr:hypothetical protein GQ44DRAFT_623364 [Phaeosphaeriaceae sp. PMI808]
MIVGLIITTILSLLVLASSICRWIWIHPSRFHLFVTRDRATTQLIIHLISHGLAIISTTILRSLINFATRLHWGNSPVLLNTIRLWNRLCVQSTSWSIPLSQLLPLSALILITTVPASIWTGALTPVVTHASTQRTLSIPAYRNTSFIREWPVEIDAQRPLISNEHGVFSYSVGLHLQARLMTSASSAMTVDGKPRQRSKLDQSQFTYSGRFYGIGISAGLEDRHLKDEKSEGYSFHESGFYTTVSCIHNTTTDFKLLNTNDTNAFRAYGMLPNSGNKGPEDLPYIGHTPDAIVAIGVGRNSEDPRRILAIAAGKYYSNLNTAQCSFKFDPTRFRVDVDLVNRAVTITPLYPIGEIFPSSANFTHTLMRQYALLSSSQSTAYMSTLGNAFNQNINNYVSNSRSHGNNRPAFSFEAATLPGLEHAFTAMADDMLLAYAGAQMYIQRDTKLVSITVTRSAFRIGKDIYIYIICAINVLLVLFSVEECIRTRAWKDMPGLDYLDPGALIIASVAGVRGMTDGKPVPRFDNYDHVEVKLCEDGSISLQEREKAIPDEEDRSRN